MKKLSIFLGIGLIIFLVEFSKVLLNIPIPRLINEDIPMIQFDPDTLEQTAAYTLTLKGYVTRQYYDGDKFNGECKLNDLETTEESDCLLSGVSMENPTYYRVFNFNFEPDVTKEWPWPFIRAYFNKKMDTVLIILDEDKNYEHIAGPATTVEEAIDSVNTLDRNGELCYGYYCFDMK